MQFSTTAEDMHAVAAELNEIYNAQREAAWDEQEEINYWSNWKSSLKRED